MRVYKACWIAETYDLLKRSPTFSLTVSTDVPCTASTFFPPSGVPGHGWWLVVCISRPGCWGWVPWPVPPPVLCRTLATPCLVPSACWLLADRSAQGEVTICLAQCWQWQQTAVARSPRNKWLRPGVGSLGPAGTLVHTLYTLCTVFVHSPVRSSNHRHFKTQENCRKLCSSPGSFAFKYPPSSFFDFDWSVAHWGA